MSIRTVSATVLFAAAAVVVLLGGLLSVGLVGEYGPAEGYGNLTLQVLPIVGVALAAGALLAWAGRVLLRRRENAGTGAR